MWGLILFGLWCFGSAQLSVELEQVSVPVQICCDDDSCTVERVLLKELLTVRQGVENVSVIVDPEFELSFGPLECQESDLLVLENNHLNQTFDLFGNGHLWVYGQSDIYVPVLEPGQFCLEQSSETQLAARACYANPCKDKLCIHKCCKLGFSLSTAEGCVEDEDGRSFSLPSQYFNKEGKVVKTPSLEPVVNAAFLPRCNFDKNEHFGLYKEEEMDDLAFHFLDDGGIVVDRTFQLYCVDRILEPNASVTTKVGGLICTEEYKESEDKIVINQLVNPILMQISSIFLLLTFIVHAILPELRTLHGKIVMCHVGAMWVQFQLLSFLNLSSVGSDPGINTPCILLAVITHFAFVSAFGWLGVMGFDICSALRSYRSSDRRRFFLYSLVAWGAAFVIAGVGITADVIANSAKSNSAEGLPDWFIHPEFGRTSCWFHDYAAMWAYMYGPLIAMLAFNVTMFALMASKLYKSSKSVAKISTSAEVQARERLRAIVRLFLLMGLTWITEIVSFSIGGSAYYWIATDIINICMPICVFFLFVWKPKVFQLLAKRYSCFGRVFGIQLDRQYTRNSSTATTSTSFQTIRSTGEEHKNSNSNLTKIEMDKLLKIDPKQGCTDIIYNPIL